MRTKSKIITLSVLTAVAVGTAAAQTTATTGRAPVATQAVEPLPDWQDGASVYLNKIPRTTGRDVENLPQSSAPPTTVPTPPAPNGTPPPSLPATWPSTASPRFDPTVTLASAELPPAPAPARYDRRLAPSTRIDTHAIEPAGRTATASRFIPQFSLPRGSLYTTATALVMVIGLFLVSVWLLRRAGRTNNKTLPAGVVNVLGRVSLANRHYADLLRVGNKLVLVSLTPGGADTLTEITEPAEVDRLAGLCQQADPRSTTRAFEDVFRQLSDVSAPYGHQGHDALPQAITTAPAAYRAFRGGATSG